MTFLLCYLTNPALRTPTQTINYIFKLQTQTTILNTTIGVYELEHDHSPLNPRLTRIKEPCKVDPHVFREEVLQKSRIKDILVDLLGPDVVLLQSKLNPKSPIGGKAIHWHQDWAFYPATNDSILALGLLLDDVTVDNGALQVIPGSHKGPVLSHISPEGYFCGAVSPDDPDFMKQRHKIKHLEGKAGSVTVHHVRLLHGSAANNSDKTRLVCFYEACASDSWPLMGGASPAHDMTQTQLCEDVRSRLVCGKPCYTPRMGPQETPVRLPLPPAPVGGSIFKTQESGGARSAF